MAFCYGRYTSNVDLRARRELGFYSAIDSHRADHSGLVVEQDRSAQKLVEATTEFIPADSVDTRFQEQEEHDSLQAIDATASVPTKDLARNPRPLECIFLFTGTVQIPTRV